MAIRRRRSLSLEDRDLWRKVADSAIPLHPRRQDEPAPAPVGVPAKPAPVVRPAVAHRVLLPVARPPQATGELAADPHPAPGRAHPQMDRRRFDKLRSGRLDPQARLDLHGMTLDRAHPALTGFVLSAYAAGLRLVLVITGKGRAADASGGSWSSQCGILRHSLPHWLAAPPLVAKVLQVAPAHPRHGGVGAFYVYLRRQRG